MKPARDDDVQLSINEPAQGLCYSRDTIQLYEIDAALPSRDDLYPDMQQFL